MSRSLVGFKNTVIRHNGERKNHLVHLCLAVTSYASDLLLHRAEHFDDLFGCIALGQIVSGTVIEKVSQQKYFFGFFALYRSHELFAIKGGAVNIGCNQNFHMVVSVPFGK